MQWKSRGTFCIHNRVSQKVYSSVCRLYFGPSTSCRLGKSGMESESEARFLIWSERNKRNLMLKSQQAQRNQ